MSKRETYKLYVVIASISIIQGMQYALSPVLGEIQAHYPDVSVSLVQMLITGPSLLAMVMSLVSGWLAVRMSIKKLLVFAACLAGVTGTLPFFVDSFALLFACRMVYGVSLGLAMSLNTAVVALFFEGEARVKAMGVQGASVGAGLMIMSFLCGILGSYGFKYSFFINLTGFLSMALLALLLPDVRSEEESGEKEKIKLGARVYKISLLGFLEFLFLITFTTNIAMHVGASGAGSTVSGTLTSIYSGVQIVIGLVLSRLTRVTKRMTLPVSMMFFAVGAVLLVLFPSAVPMLVIASLLCGLSQGVFMPTGMVEVSDAVPASSAAMAAGVYSCAVCLGQLISPTVLNSLSKVLFGSVNTGDVYLIAVVGMAISAALGVIIERQGEKKPADAE